MTLDDCFDKFRTEELLVDDNQVYCRNCKEHKDAYKKMDVYKLPNILIIQLKRFNRGSRGSSYGMSYGMGMASGASKNSDLIDFPLEGLDMEKYLLDPSSGEQTVYDLYGISNHMGSLYGGHYTANCRNSVNGNWYNFNDSSVSKTSEGSLVSAAAYVLFY